jgi:hypothetical protein
MALKNPYKSDKSAAINLALYYFKVDNGFYHYFDEQADLETTTSISGKHSMIITESNKPLCEILNLYNYKDPSPFIIFRHGKRIAFAIYTPSETLEQKYPFKKGLILQNGYRYTPNFSGIISLIATTRGVETIPHKNVYKPQLAFYDITNKEHAFAIHMIFKYLSINKFKPELNDNFIQINSIKTDPINLTEKLNGEDDLNIKLEQNGKLIREI